MRERRQTARFTLALVSLTDSNREYLHMLFNDWAWKYKDELLLGGYAVPLLVLRTTIQKRGKRDGWMDGLAQFSLYLSSSIFTCSKNQGERDTVDGEHRGRHGEKERRVSIELTGWGETHRDKQGAD